MTASERRGGEEVVKTRTSPHETTRRGRKVEISTQVVNLISTTVLQSYSLVTHQRMSRYSRLTMTMMSMSMSDVLLAKPFLFLARNFCGPSSAQETRTSD